MCDEYRGVRLIHTAKDHLKLLMHHHLGPVAYDDFGPIGTRSSIELALIDQTSPGHVVARKTLPTAFCEIFVNSSASSLAWCPDRRSVIVTRISDLADTAIISLRPEPHIAPLSTDTAALPFYEYDGPPIVWSTAGNLLAIRTIRREIGDESASWTSLYTVSLFICSTVSGVILHELPLPDLFGFHDRSASFNPDESCLAFWGRLPGWQNAREELLLLRIATGQVIHWHHADFQAPLACIGWELQWSPTSLWLALYINRLSDVEDRFDEAWACEYSGVSDKEPEKLTLSSQEDRISFAVSAADGQILHMWQPVGCGDTSACRAGFFDACTQQMLYIGTLDVLWDLEDRDLDLLPISLPESSSLQARLGLQLPCSCAAQLSPNGELVLDFLRNTCYYPCQAELSGGAEPQRASVLLHYSVQDEHIHLIHTGCAAVLHGNFDPVWLPHNPGRLIYALALEDASICLVDVHNHSVLRSWRPVGHELSLSPKPIWQPMQDPGEPEAKPQMVRQLRWLDGGRALALSSILYMKGMARWVAAVTVHSFHHP